MAIDEIEVDRDKKYINDLTELMIFDDDVLCYSTSCISDESDWEFISSVWEFISCMGIITSESIIIEIRRNKVNPIV